MQASEDASKHAFAKLKPICVPLLGNSRIHPRSIPQILAFLTDLKSVLMQFRKSKFPMQPSMISYVFYPLSSILSRNEPAVIPDQVIEKVFEVLEILFEHWWWTCDLKIWEQVFMLAGSILGGIDGRGKGKGKERADETKEAAASLLLCLLADHSQTDQKYTDQASQDIAMSKIAERRALCQKDAFTPIFGQAFDSVLTATKSPHLNLQLTSIHLVSLMLQMYMPESLILAVVPGVVSTMTRIALGETFTKTKAWAKGELVDAALDSLKNICVLAFSDEKCKADGVVVELDDLNDLTELLTDMNDSKASSAPTREPKYGIARSPTWLRGTSSQLLIALNTLTPLVKHPSPIATLSLSNFAFALLSETRLTLPMIQPLLLATLLSLSNSEYADVESAARTSLLTLLSPPSQGRATFLRVLMQMATNNLTALPRLLPSRADEKIEHLAGQILAVCQLGYATSSGPASPPSSLVAAIHSGIGKILGPSGHIERWGWTLLSVLEFATPTIALPHWTGAHLSIEGSLQSTGNVAFPRANLKFITTKSTQAAVEAVFRALGRASGEMCVPSIEWFVAAGCKGPSAGSVAALWCAAKLLEGVINMSLEETVSATTLQSKGRRLEKLARWLTLTIAESWNAFDGRHTRDAQSEKEESDDQILPSEFIKGLIPLDVKFHPMATLSKRPKTFSYAEDQPILHEAFSLQIICIAAAVLKSSFQPLLIHALYPILRSLVSLDAHLSLTAYAALQYISQCCGYATPANLLLANFDYALDSISRRLTRRWLDISAAKVLVMLIKLVGKDIVVRADDVVEECFDRLDDFHGYTVIVAGLIEALQEVVKAVVEQEEPPVKDPRYQPVDDLDHKVPDSQRVELFIQWFQQRTEPPLIEEDTDIPDISDDDPNADSSEKPPEPDPTAEPPSTPTQDLTKRIISRSLYFLTHGSPAIRAHILSLLAQSVPVLQASALLPTVHRVWPFVLNRLADHETFVISAAVSLVEALATHVGDFMTSRIWDDVWPRFQKMLGELGTADASSSLAKRGRTVVSTESAYTHSHRIYRAMLRTMIASVRGIQSRDAKAWEVMLAFLRFLHNEAHVELQECARNLYVALAENNEDAVWLILNSASSKGDNSMVLKHLRQNKWDIDDNVKLILSSLDSGKTTMGQD